MDSGLPWTRSIRLAGGAAKDAVLELILPPACRLCDLPVGSNDDFCRRCELTLTLSEAMMRAACTRCGVPSPHPNRRPISVISDQNDSELDSSPPRMDQNGDTQDWDPGVPEPCLHCRNSNLHFDGVVTLWSYQDRVCDAVVAAKYAHQSPLGDALGRRLGHRVAARYAEDLPDFVTFVPSHLTRQFMRGGNGNLAIADAVAQIIGRPCRFVLRTTRRIAKQAWLDDAQRRENVRGAFSPKKAMLCLDRLGSPIGMFWWLTMF